jgi:hypothetical protein
MSQQMMMPINATCELAADDHDHDTTSSLSSLALWSTPTTTAALSSLEKVPLLFRSATKIRGFSR